MKIKDHLKIALIVFALAISAKAVVEIRDIEPQADEGKPDVSDKNFAEQLKFGPSPIITGQWVTFVYRGNGRNVELVGEMTDWEKRGMKLQYLNGTSSRYLSMKFPDDARIEYKYVVDENWTLDSLNLNRKDNGVGGENNFFLMPRYKATGYTRERDTIRHGRMAALDLAADASNRKREARIYLPPGYDESSERYPTVYFGDGIEYIERAGATVIADNLIAERKMRPLIMVFLAPIDRNKEYWMNAAYVEWLVKELVPMIDSKYRTRAAPGSRAIAGASLGGLIAAYAALTHPEVFGNVLGQSSAFQVDDGRIITDFTARERKPVNFYLETGRYEGLIDSNRKMKEALEKKGYKLAYREVNAGHNWTHWADNLADALSHLFAK
ncbi:MAG: alpha/beta hydrolase-fold protein [Blastocatellia bacterium]